ncbi:sulfurtransferase TusA family protein [Geosporobacter ferrireducens]|uniref:UPF0033 domain-containing protein n=1 Tax=Geosporobacter ferrireducens TaxID=1424294 RepID=A0A1D8GHH6_9FIRM|nr:sulfurtransferase TusA family protein [Geosporobacter ferrireducens]AOT70368.1 hypothetical protein Gferi_12660 [Geosporobacter ferrireducens]MTI54341.1 preprotein translocase subunit TatB [Geosporobacter ferrireducens]
MKLKTIDARGRSCPEPVLMTKKAVALNSEGIQVLVDNTTACENIKRFGSHSGYKVEVAEKGEDFVLTLKK